MSSSNYSEESELISLSTLRSRTSRMMISSEPSWVLPTVGPETESVSISTDRISQSSRVSPSWNNSTRTLTLSPWELRNGTDGISPSWLRLSLKMKSMLSLSNNSETRLISEMITSPKSKKSLRKENSPNKFWMLLNPVWDKNSLSWISLLSKNWLLDS